MENLREEIIGVNQYFKFVIDLIPWGAYILKSEQPDKDPESFGQDLGKCARKAIVKRKKLNPKYMKSVSETLSKDHESEDEGIELKFSENVPHMINKDLAADSIEELHKKLRQKLEDMKSKRKIDQKKYEERKKAKLEKSKKPSKRKPKPVDDDENLNKKVKVESEKSVSNGVEIRNNEGKIVYSKFDFGQSNAPSKKEKKQKASSGKNYKKLLNKALYDKEEHEKLKEAEPEKAVIIEQKEIWKKALAKAEGAKIKDDPDMLKKSIKRKESKKKASAKKWADLDKQVSEKMDKRQQKRDRNIQRKKDDRSSRKKQKKRKVPGF